MNFGWEASAVCATIVYDTMRFCALQNGMPRRVVHWWIVSVKSKELQPLELLYFPYFESVLYWVLKLALHFYIIKIFAITDYIILVAFSLLSNPE